MVLAPDDRDDQPAGRKRRRMVISASDDEWNRNGLMIKTGGIDFETYLGTNPVVLWAHDDGPGWFGGSSSDGIPIGRSPALELDSRKRLVCRTSSSSPRTPSSSGWENAYDQGYLNASSIGIIPRKVSKVRRDGGGEGYVVDESELVEWSLVSIPADRNAIRELSLAAGLPEDLFGLGTLEIMPPEPQPVPALADEAIALVRQAVAQELTR